MVKGLIWLEANISGASGGQKGLTVKLNELVVLREGPLSLFPKHSIE